VSVVLVSGGTGAGGVGIGPFVPLFRAGVCPSYSSVVALVLVVDFVLAAFALVLVCTSRWRGAGGGVVLAAFMLVLAVLVVLVGGGAGGGVCAGGTRAGAGGVGVDVFVLLVGAGVVLMCRPYSSVVALVVVVAYVVAVFALVLVVLALAHSFL
jgi:hypothetical protein